MITSHPIIDEGLKTTIAASSPSTGISVFLPTFLFSPHIAIKTLANATIISYKNMLCQENVGREWKQLKIENLLLEYN